MTAPGPNGGAASPHVARMWHDVLSRGWHAAGGATGANTSGWRYTVGLHHTYQHPEFVVVGLAEDVMQAILDTTARHVQAGVRFEAGRRYDGILLSYACAFEAVDRHRLPEYLPGALAFYGARRFPALQCLWPDRAGYYPPDRRCDPAVRAVQQCLFDTPAGTPRTGAG